MVWFASVAAWAGGWEILDERSEPGAISFSEVAQLTVPLDGSVDLSGFTVEADGVSWAVDALIDAAGVKGGAVDLVPAGVAGKSCTIVDALGVCPAPARIVVGPDTAPFVFQPSGKELLAFPVDGTVDLAAFRVATRDGDVPLDRFVDAVAASRFAEIDGESKDAEHKGDIDLGPIRPRFCVVLFGVRICAPA